MKEFVAYLIKNLVDKPSDVEVVMTGQEKEMKIDVRAASGDIAKIIGPKGKNIKSLRTITEAIGARFGCRVRVNVID